jgi:hypothetical protein
MSNFLYSSFKTALLTNGLGTGVSMTNTTSPKVTAALVSTSYAPTSASTDQYWSAGTAALIGTKTALSSPTVTAGVFNAATLDFGNVSAGGTATAIVLFFDTGTPATSQLIAYIDTATGLPVVPNGGDIQVAWDTGANKIFAL